VNTPHRFDDITVEQLVAQGSMKWTRMPGHLAAFVAEMDFGTAPAVTDALQGVLNASQWGYLPPAAIRDMSQATGEFLSHRFGWEVSPSRIYPTADVLSAYEVVLERFTTPGSPVIVPTPAYMPFLTLTPMRGRDVIQVPMVEDLAGRPAMNLEAIAEAFTRGAELLVLCNPHNPLGLVYTRAELEALAEVVDQHGGRVFSDEIHSPITFPGHSHIPYASVNDVAASHTLTAMSASKAWNIPGLKCAQLIVSNDHDQKVFSEFAFMVSHGAATPGVVANTAAFRGGAEWLTDVLEYIDGNRSFLTSLLGEHLPEIAYREPEGTYIAWLDARGLPDVKGERSWAKFFSEEAAVGLTDGALCGEAGVDHLRLMLSTPRHILEKIVLQMAAALRAA
jgi:cysteine-S-conjugate beta-lyase